MSRTPDRSESLLCSLGWHSVTPFPRYNNGFYFAQCRRCGTDLVRTTYGGWHVPAGHRVVWQRETPDRAPRPELASDDVSAMIGRLEAREAAELVAARLGKRPEQPAPASAPAAPAPAALPLPPAPPAPVTVAAAVAEPPVAVPPEREPEGSAAAPSNAPALSDGADDAAASPMDEPASIPGETPAPADTPVAGDAAPATLAETPPPLTTTADIAPVDPAPAEAEAEAGAAPASTSEATSADPVADRDGAGASPADTPASGEPSDDAASAAAPDTDGSDAAPADDTPPAIGDPPAPDAPGLDAPAPDAPAPDQSSESAPVASDGEVAADAAPGPDAASDAGQEGDEDGPKSVVPDFMDNPWPIDRISEIAAQRPRERDVTLMTMSGPPVFEPTPATAPALAPPPPDGAAGSAVDAAIAAPPGGIAAPVTPTMAPAPTDPAASPAADRAQVPPASMENLGLPSLDRLANNKERTDDRFRAATARDGQGSKGGGKAWPMLAIAATIAIVAVGGWALTDDSAPAPEDAVIVDNGIGDNGIGGVDVAPSGTDVTDPAAAAASAGVAYIDARRLNCRAQPTRSAASLAVLERGRRVRVTEERGEWSGLAVVGGSICWTQTRFLSDTPRA